MRAICHETMLPSLQQNRDRPSGIDTGFRRSMLGPWSFPGERFTLPSASKNRAHRGRGCWLNLPYGGLHLLLFCQPCPPPRFASFFRRLEAAT